MPPIASEKQVFDRLCNLVGPSVVVIGRYIGNNFVDFGTGFVIVSDHNQVLICVHESIVNNDENLLVRFYDGLRKKATLFARNTESKHVILKTSCRASRHRACVHFTKYPVRRQNIFTMAALEAAGRIGLMSGTVSIPNCRAVRPNYAIVHGSENLFAMSCPLSGPKVPEDTEGLRLVGAAVFDMKCLVIGTVDHVDSCSFDIKYARKTSSFLNNLERSLKDIDDTISLSKGEQGGFTAGAGTSGWGGTTAGSKKRGRDDPTSGGKSTKKSLCMDQLKVNVEVASEENSRLHMFPLQSDMDVGRREAMRRELVRLVTQESDDQRTGEENSRLHMFPLRGDMDGGRREAVRRELVRLVTRKSDDRRTGSPSSQDLCVEMRSRGQDCMKLNINIPSIVSHLDNAPHSASLLLENQATSAQRVVIASGLSQAGVKVDKS